MSRKNIVQPPDWWEAFQSAANDAGKSLSDWMGEQCFNVLPANVQKQLSDRRGVGQPRKHPDA